MISPHKAKPRAKNAGMAVPSCDVANARAHTRAANVKRELAQDRARWRNGRRVPDFRDVKVTIRVIERDERQGECDRMFCADEIEFRREQL